MSKKSKIATPAVTPELNADGSPVAQIIPAKTKKVRVLMTEAEKAASKASRQFKKLANTANFADPALWAALPPEIVAGVEKACIHVRTIIHAAEREALKARLAVLEGADNTAPVVPAAPAAAPAQA